MKFLFYYFARMKHIVLVSEIYISILSGRLSELISFYILPELSTNWAREVASATRRQINDNHSINHSLITPLVTGKLPWGYKQEQDQILPYLIKLGTNVKSYLVNVQKNHFSEKIVFRRDIAEFWKIFFGKEITAALGKK